MLVGIACLICCLPWLKAGHRGVFTIRVDSDQIYDKTQRYDLAGTLEEIKIDSERPYSPSMTILRSIGLVILSIAEIGGALAHLAGSQRETRAHLHRSRSHRQRPLRILRHLPTQPNFGRILAAYGESSSPAASPGASSSTTSRPDRYDMIGAAICLLGVAVVIYTPRAIG